MRSSAEFQAESALRRLGYDVRGLTKSEILEHFYAALPDEQWDAIKADDEIARANSEAREKGFESWVEVEAAKELARAEAEAEARWAQVERRSQE
jgi:hypothetical protein